MRIEDIEALEKAATPGPWLYNSVVGDGSSPFHIMPDKNGKCIVGANIIIEGNKERYDGVYREEDAKFIAAARSLMPKLIAVARAAKRASNNLNEFGAFTDCEFSNDLFEALEELEKDT